jgi:hypothetical protein
MKVSKRNDVVELYKKIEFVSFKFKGCGGMVFRVAVWKLGSATHEEGIQSIWHFISHQNDAYYGPKLGKKVSRYFQAQPVDGLFMMIYIYSNDLCLVFSGSQFENWDLRPARRGFSRFGTLFPIKMMHIMVQSWEKKCHVTFRPSR